MKNNVLVLLNYVNYELVLALIPEMTDEFFENCAALAGKTVNADMLTEEEERTVQALDTLLAADGEWMRYRAIESAGSFSTPPEHFISVEWY